MAHINGDYSPEEREILLSILPEMNVSIERFEEIEKDISGMNWLRKGIEIEIQ